MTDTAESIEPKPSPLAVYDEFRVQLEDLKQLDASLVFDYEDPIGNKDARSHIYKLRQTRSAVDKARATAKASALEYGRRVDGEAKEIMGAIGGMIDRHASAIEAIEERERIRVEAHQNKLEAIDRFLTALSPDATAETIRKAVEAVEAVDVGPDWQEFEDQAGQTRERVLEALRERLVVRERYEADQAELEALRQREAAREAEQAEKDKALEQTMIATRAAEEALEQAEKQEAAAASDKSVEATVHSAILGALIDLAGLDTKTGKRVVTAIAKGRVPHVVIRYSQV